MENASILITMNELEEQEIQCPYCGEVITVLVDCSVASQEYIEDCQVCCRPIYFTIIISNTGDINVSTKTEND
jgi:hypothetical protein